MNARRWALLLATAYAALSAGRLAAAEPAPPPRPEATAGGCAGPMADSIAFVSVPGHPFQAIPSRDGCWLYVSMIGEDPDSANGVAVLRRSAGGASVVRTIPVESGPAGMVLTHDGALLVVSAQDQVVFMDTARLESGEGDPILGRISDGKDAGSVYVNCTRDDRWLFVSDEAARAITVIDLARARATGFRPDAIVGRIPVGRAPIALTFSPDERTLFTTSQVALPAWGWKAECVPEGMDPAPAAPTNPAGAVIVIDVERAKSKPAGAVVARVPAGCSPVRLALAPGGGRAYVTARNSNAVLAFDTARMLADPQHARTGTVPVGRAPVGIAVARAGGRDVVVVGNSNRFAGGGASRESLSVIDAAGFGAGAAAVIGHIPAGGFPRELRVSDDGRTLIVTNFLSSTVEFVDLERVSRGWSQPPGR